jgi:hypothetical protein
MGKDALNKNDAPNVQPDAGAVEPAILAELTRAVLPYLGPYSITTVKRASRSTTNANEVVRLVAQHIDDLGKRELFIKNAKRILSDVRAANIRAPMPSRAPQVNTGGRPATPITPELIRRGETALATIIGPLATVLVQRYAKVSENSRDFFERLAGHLRSAEERESFFASVRDGSGLQGDER